MRSVIRPNHIQANAYEMRVLGYGLLNFTEISPISAELNVLTMPDRTQESGGIVNATEFTARIPSHHGDELLILEAWYLEAQDPVSATYKRTANLIRKNISGGLENLYLISGLWIYGRTIDNMNLNNDGEMATIEYKFRADEILPIPII